MIAKISVKQAEEILTKKILELRKINPKHPLCPRLMKFYKTTLASYQEYYMDNTEENYEYNENVMNSILDWTGELNKILKKDKPISENIIMKRLPTKEEEQGLLKTVHANFMIGIPRLLNDPKYKNIDFKKTFKNAVKKGIISINQKGLILSLNPKNKIGNMETGVYDSDKINNPHSINETYNMKKSQLKTLLKEIIKEISNGRVNSGGNEYENYEIELESLVISFIISFNNVLSCDFFI